jgi:hypothetical protein
MSKADNKIIKKIIIGLALIFIGYFSYQYFKFSALKKHAKTEISKNIDNEIFELASEYKDQEIDLSELTINEMREKGAEFIYQILLKNQLQIENLKSDLKAVNQELLKYQNQQKIGKLILSYAALRDDFWQEKNYQRNLESFEILSRQDENLKKLSQDLKNNLAKFIGAEKLNKNFHALIPQLLAVKNHGNEDDLFSQIRRGFSKIIVVKNTKKKQGNEIEAIIFRCENNLKQQEYSKVLDDLNLAAEIYQEVLKTFLEEVKIANEIKQIDKEILNYLNQIS